MRKAGKLPTFKGYIVDYSMRQFRSQPPDFGLIEFIAFGSVRGMELLTEMKQRDLLPPEIIKEVFG